MPWLERTDNSKRKVGHPEVQVFPDPENEKRFVLRAGEIVRLYYRKGEGRDKSFYEFEPERHISKTLFWAFIYIYYLDMKVIDKNLDGFVTIVQSHFGKDVISDRSSTCKKVGQMNDLYEITSDRDDGILHDKETYNRLFGIEKSRIDFRQKYLYTIGKWEECPTPVSPGNPGRCP